MAKLTAATRNALPTKDFALPGKRAFPIPDPSHARNALARASGKPVEAEVRAKVKAKFPSIGKRSPSRDSMGQRLNKGAGLSHDAFEALDHGTHDHMIGRGKA